VSSAGTITPLAAVLAAALLAALAACAPQPPRPAEPPAPAASPARPAAPPEALDCESIERLEVQKQARRIVAYCVGGGRFEATIALGREPVGDKRFAGDMRTPEGRYHVVGPIEPSRFHGFIPLDYPSLDDAAAALADGRISRADHDAIVAAHAEGRMPPSDTPLGGGIGLHGEGERWCGLSSDVDWTLGCLAVDDATLDFLAERLEMGTPCVILP